MAQVRRQANLPRPSWGWQDAAACRGEDLVLFFGPDGERQPEREIRERKAKQICMGCPVRTECLDYAVSRPEKSAITTASVSEIRLAARPAALLLMAFCGSTAFTPPHSPQLLYRPSDRDPCCLLRSFSKALI